MSRGGSWFRCVAGSATPCKFEDFFIIFGRFLANCGPVYLSLFLLFTFSFCCRQAVHIGTQHCMVGSYFITVGTLVMYGVVLPNSSCVRISHAAFPDPA